MSPSPHLLIPLAASHAEGCRQALHDLALPRLDRLLVRLTPAGQDAGSETDPTPPHERALARHLGLPADAPPWAAWQRQQTDPQDAQASAWAISCVLCPADWRAAATWSATARPSASTQRPANTAPAWRRPAIRCSQPSAASSASGGITGST